VALYEGFFNYELKITNYEKLTGGRVKNNYKLKMQLSWLKAEIFITAGERSVACGSRMDCFGLRPRNDERKVNEWTG
jgi:hypothetical protein